MNNESGWCDALDIRQRADLWRSPRIIWELLEVPLGHAHPDGGRAGSAVWNGRHLGSPFSREVGQGGGRPGVHVAHVIFPVLVVMSCFLGVAFIFLD
jgi:hypothetical protein